MFLCSFLLSGRAHCCDSIDGLEARAFDVDVADLVARSHFARTIVDMLEARSGPSSGGGPSSGNGNAPGRSHGSRSGPGPSRSRLDYLSYVQGINGDPPRYRKHDANNGRKPAYMEKDLHPVPKYRQKDPNPPGGHPAQRKKQPPPTGGRKREVEFAGYW